MGLSLFAGCAEPTSSGSLDVDDLPTSAADDLVLPDDDIPTSAADDLVLPNDDIPASSIASAPAPSPSADSTISLTAAGQQNTDSFTLAEGSYAVEYDFRAACLYAADLNLLLSDSADLVIMPITTAVGPVAGSTNLYGLEGGEYYVGVLTGPTPTCPWSIVLRRQE